MTLWVAAHQGALLSYQVWRPQALWQQRYNDFCLSRYFARPRDQGVVCLYCYEPFKISHNPTKFHGHRHCFSLSCDLARSSNQKVIGTVAVDIIILVYHVILQDHVILHVGARKGKSPSCQVWWSQALWQWKYNNFHLSRDFARSHDQNRALSDFMVRSPSR